MNIAAPALNWQPAVVTNILPKPTLDGEWNLYRAALYCRKRYQETLAESWKSSSFEADLTYLFAVERRQHYIIRCPKRTWETKRPINLLIDPSILMIFNLSDAPDKIRLLPFDKEAKAADYKRASEMLHLHRRQSVHPADNALVDDAMSYFVQRERQCRDAAPRPARSQPA